MLWNLIGTIGGRVLDIVDDDNQWITLTINKDEVFGRQCSMEILYLNSKSSIAIADTLDNCLVRLSPESQFIKVPIVIARRPN